MAGMGLGSFAQGMASGYSNAQALGAMRDLRDQLDLSKQNSPQPMQGGMGLIGQLANLKQIGENNGETGAMGLPVSFRSLAEKPTSNDGGVASGVWSLIKNLVGGQ